YDLVLSEEAIDHFVWMANGDMRSALNALELAALTTNPSEQGKISITLDIAEQSSQRRAMSVDESLYYDIISAFCKSLRGSDPDAALYYALRLLNAGCDPLLVARRLVVHSAEDVGLADPNALNIAVNALRALERLGLPEGRIPLAEAIIYVALAPKSNSVVEALALADQASKQAEDAGIPAFLRDQTYSPANKRDTGYQYPHDFGGWVEQQYLPDKLKDVRFYFPSKNGAEQTVTIPKLQERKDSQS
ncbi:MAG: replication-associated recombination protein A, partial [Clostridia bacterium]